jgi:hypothetical protein
LRRVLKPSTGTGDDHLAVGYHLARVAVSEVLVRVGDEVDHGVVKEEADQGSDSDRQQGDRKALAELRKVFEQCHAVQPVAVAVRGTRAGHAAFVGVTPPPPSDRWSLQAAASPATRRPRVSTAAMTAGSVMLSCLGPCWRDQWSTGTNDGPIGRRRRHVHRDSFRYTL